MRNVLPELVFLVFIVIIAIGLGYGRKEYTICHGADTQRAHKPASVCENHSRWIWEPMP